MSWLEGALKAIQLKPRHLLAVALLCLLPLVLPYGWRDGLGIETIVAPYRGWIALVGIAALCFGVVQFIPAIRARWGQRRIRKNALRALDALSQEERLLLAYCLYRGRRTVLLHLTETPANVAAGLGHKYLMMMAAGSHNVLAWPHTIPDFVWEELQLRRDEFVPQELIENPQFTEYCEHLDFATSGRHWTSLF